MDKKFLVCGGDLRQTEAAKMICDHGYDVHAFGFGAGMDIRPPIKYYTDLEQALEGVDIVVLPLPCSSDNETVNMPQSKEMLLFSELLGKMNKKQIIVAGNVPEKFLGMARAHGIYIADYYDREELKISNAIPTVEGALMLAIEETAITIHGAKCMVLGYGRIGKLLSNALKSLGADVTVSARKHSDLAWIKSFGCRAVQTEKIDSVISEQDIIFNTIPFTVLDRKILEKVSGSCLIIDLASKPGGVDFDAASMLGIRVIWALSLPGKTAPITAGKIITETIINLVRELGV